MFLADYTERKGAAPQGEGTCLIDKDCEGSLVRKINACMHNFKEEQVYFFYFRSVAKGIVLVQPPQLILAFITP